MCLLQHHWLCVPSSEECRWSKFLAPCFIPSLRNSHWQNNVQSYRHTNYHKSYSLFQSVTLKHDPTYHRTFSTHPTFNSEEFGLNASNYSEWFPANYDQNITTKTTVTKGYSFHRFVGPSKQSTLTARIPKRKRLSFLPRKYDDPNRENSAGNPIFELP